MTKSTLLLGVFAIGLASSGMAQPLGLDWEMSTADALSALDVIERADVSELPPEARPPLLHIRTTDDPSTGLGFGFTREAVIIQWAGDSAIVVLQFFDDKLCEINGLWRTRSTGQEIDSALRQKYGPRIEHEEGWDIWYPGEGAQIEFYGGGDRIGPMISYSSPSFTDYFVESEKRARAPAPGPESSEF